MKRALLTLALLMTVTACQSTGGTTTASPDAETPAETTATETAEVATDDTPTAQTAVIEPPETTVATCSVELASGPPPKPAQGADFAKNAVGNNIKRNVGRNAITQIGGRIGGGLGGAIAGGLARQAIRSEQDLDGNWTLTDGSPNCGCAIEISAGVSLQGSEATRGPLKQNNCTTIASATRWSLGGRSFTGYNTTFTLLASDRRTVLATMNRDGINYFSGTLADGRAVTMWRRGG
ncbi:MAG: hypothetical protein AAGI92_03265 [Pseudomonadota bacterium]